MTSQSLAWRAAVLRQQFQRIKARLRKRGLVDFGLAAEFQDGPPYMAPEQLQGGPLTRPSTLYAVGEGRRSTSTGCGSPGSRPFRPRGACWWSWRPWPRCPLHASPGLTPGGDLGAGALRAGQLGSVAKFE